MMGSESAVGRSSRAGWFGRPPRAVAAGAVESAATDPALVDSATPTVDDGATGADEADETDEADEADETDEGDEADEADGDLTDVGRHEAAVNDRAKSA